MAGRTEISLTGVYAWTQEATQALLSLWGKENIQKQLKEVRRNRCVFEKIAESLNSMGYDFSWKQCRTKVKNLSQFYRKAVRESAGKEDIKEPNCPFFKELDYIFNPSEAVVPPLFQTNSNSDVDEAGFMQEVGFMQESVLPTSHAAEAVNTHAEEQVLQDVATELVRPHSNTNSTAHMALEEEEEEDEEEEEEEEEELVGVQQQWQQVPLMVVASAEGSLPQTIMYQPSLKTRGVARQDRMTRQQGMARQHAQQQGSTRKQGVARHGSLTGQQLGLARLEPVLMQQQQQGVRTGAAFRNSRLLKHRGQGSVRKPGGTVTITSQQQQQSSVANMQTDVLDALDSGYQEQNTGGIGDSSREGQTSLGQGFSRKRKALDNDILELMERLQEEAEDREDARQQRLLEHESRMEEKRQHWEEQRREREFQQQQQLTQMFLQALEHLDKHQ